MYRLWKEDPAQVHPSWNVYFSGMARGLKSEDAFRPPPSLVDLESMTTEGSADVPSASTGSDVQDHMKVSSLCNGGIAQQATCSHLLAWDDWIINVLTA